MSLARLILVAAAAAAGCSGETAVDPLVSYERALAETDASPAPEAGSAEEKRAVERFIDFYRDFSTERVRERVRDLYAKDAYFRDPFKEVHGIEEVEFYFLSSTEAIEEGTFDIQDWAQHSGDYYFRWVMKLRLARSPDDPPIRIAGMSHVRFDAGGQV
ncbi:MAG: nuclear transport factor 2 family protein, partial [Candidatus Binatia bacterium]